MIILISGLKRAGKDTVGQMLNELIPDSSVEHFAAPLKRIFATTYKLSLDKLDELKNNEKVVCGFRSPSERLCTGITVRGALQRLGTEAMKAELGESVWGDLLVKKYLNSDKPIMIVPDFRFNSELIPIENAEIHYVKVRVNNPECVTTDLHPSETEWQNMKFDYTIENNGTLEELKEKVEAIVQDIIK